METARFPVISQISHNYCRNAAKTAKTTPSPLVITKDLQKEQRLKANNCGL